MLERSEKYMDTAAGQQFKEAATAAKRKQCKLPGLDVLCLSYFREDFEDVVHLVGDPIGFPLHR